MTGLPGGRPNFMIMSSCRRSYRNKNARGKETFPLGPSSSVSLQLWGQKKGMQSTLNEHKIMSTHEKFYVYNLISRAIGRHERVRAFLVIEVRRGIQEKRGKCSVH